MNIKGILMMYSKYRLTYNEAGKVFVFRNAIRVRDFIRFKKDLKANGIKYNNIRVIEW